MQYRIQWRLLLQFSLVLLAMPMHAWNPGYQLRLQCGQIVTGGSELQVIFPNSGGDSVAIHELESGNVQTIIKLDSPIHDVQLSPSCRWVTFCTFDRDTSRSTVRIVSRSGKGVQDLTDARFYAWGTDVAGSDCIAYIVGQQSERESEGFQSRGTWILNMESGEQRQIHPRGQELAWAEYDRNFYIGDWPNKTPPSPKVQRYNLKANALEDTSYHGVDFSPDGTYYHTRSYEGEGLNVYLRETNENISNRYSAMLDKYFNGNPIAWLNDSMIVFGSYRRMNVKNRIIDFDRAEGWEVAEEVVGFADEEEKDLLLLVDGKVVRRSFAEVATLIYPVPEVAENAEGNPNP